MIEQFKQLHGTVGEDIDGLRIQLAENEERLKQYVQATKDLQDKFLRAFSQNNFITDENQKKSMKAIDDQFAKMNDEIASLKSSVTTIARRIEDSEEANQKRHEAVSTQLELLVNALIPIDEPKKGERATGRKRPLAGAEAETAAGRGRGRGRIEASGRTESTPSSSMPSTRQGSGTHLPIVKTEPAETPADKENINHLIAEVRRVRNYPSSSEEENSELDYQIRRSYEEFDYAYKMGCFGKNRQIALNMWIKGGIDEAFRLCDLPGYTKEKFNELIINQRKMFESEQRKRLRQEQKQAEWFNKEKIDKAQQEMLARQAAERRRKEEEERRRAERARDNPDNRPFKRTRR